jgi:hypothetical protein
MKVRLKLGYEDNSLASKNDDSRTYRRHKNTLMTYQGASNKSTNSE